jgi:hypothetical protein
MSDAPAAAASASAAAPADAAAAPAAANDAPSSNSSSSTTTTSGSAAAGGARLLGSKLREAASSVKTGIKAIGDNIDANLQTAAAGLAAGVSALPSSLPGAVAGLSSLPSAVAGPSAAQSAADVPDRTASQAAELVYRTRDLRRSSEALSRRFLAREVEYATGSADAYEKTLIKEVKNSKAVLRPLHDAVGSLAAGVGGARGVAAGFAGGMATA